MRLDFLDIIDSHKGYPALVACSGPSLNPYLGRMAELKSKDYVIVGCNEWYYFYDLPPDLWVIANPKLTVRNESGKANSVAGKTILCYADSVDLTDRDWVARELKCDYLPYDQRHFDGKPCHCKTCCHHVIPGRLTIQEELRRYTTAPGLYGPGDSVALHCLALAILCGCNPVYVAGMDLDYQLGYATNSANLISKVDSTPLEHFRERILDQVAIIRDSIKLIGRRIVNLNKASSFGVLEKGDLP